VAGWTEEGECGRRKGEAILKDDRPKRKPRKGEGPPSEEEESDHGDGKRADWRKGREEPETLKIMTGGGHQKRVERGRTQLRQGRRDFAPGRRKGRTEWEPGGT